MTGGGPEKPGWGTTKTIEVVEDAVRSALAEAEDDGPGDLTETKIPLKLIVPAAAFLLVQALAGSTLYYDLRADVRSLQESESSATSTDLRLVEVQVESIRDRLQKIEEKVDSPPTPLDHARVVGDIKTDLKLIEQRVQFLERKNGRRR